jgi:hypothetical protein
MPTTTTTVKTTTALLAAATAALALTAVGPAGAAASSTKCGSVKTRNGGQARFIFAQKVSCTSARSIAKKANGKTYKYGGFTCRPVAGLYGCSKPGTTRSVGFSYRKPS